MKNILFLFLLFVSSFIFSQNDCKDVITVCGNSGYSDLTVSGFGTQELSGSNTCSSQENNSIWFRLHIKTAGTLGFTLTPKNNAISEDFDFFVFGPDVNCGNIGTAIRCSTTNPAASGQTNNLTGMNGTENDTSEGPGAAGNNFVKWLDVKAGESYFLVIDRPIGTSNFDLTWTGSATFSDQPIIDLSILSGNTLNLTECDNDGTNDNITDFDLTKNNSIIGTQTDIDATYHLSNNDAILGTNSIPNPNIYKNISNPQSIFIRLTNKNTKCFVTKSFDLNISPYITLNDPNNLISCSNNGFSTFDLTNNSFISTNPLNKISFHSSENNAKNNINPQPANYTNKAAFTNEIIWVRVENTNSCFSLKSFSLTILKIPSPTQPTNILFCDVDNDGFNIFDLQATKTPEVLGGQDPVVFEVKYFLSQVDADTNTNEITNPYTNPTTFSSQTIYARMHNKVAPDACYDIKTFTLAVTGKPVPQTPIDYENCDDTINGGDIDGFYNNFILSTKDTEILGSLDPNIYDVTYHTTLNGAQTDNITNVIDKNNPYRNITINSQTIYIRVENKNNTACNDTSISFNLVVNPLPVISSIAELKQCDNDTDAFADFNLEEARSDISLNYLNETFFFYPTLVDAQNNTMPITNPTVFPNRTVTSDIVWVRTISDKGCYRVSQVNLTVSTTGIPATFQRPFYQCDDFLDIDGNDNANNSDIDGVTSFDFSSVDAEIKALFTATGQKTNVTYYRNEADALAEANKITDTSNYRNIGYPNTQQIYVRVDSDLDNDCLGFGPHITLNVNSTPLASTLNPIELCDDFDSGAFNDGKNININIRNQVSTILGTQDPANFTVTLHNSATDANLGNNPILNDTNYTNQTRDIETIYVRVTNNNTGCFNDHEFFDIIINPLPIITNAIPNLEICDVATPSDGDTRNGFAQNINLSERDAEVLNGRDPNIFEVSYHSTLQNAINGTTPLPKNNYSNQPGSTNIPPAIPLNDNPATEVIHISILNKTTGCRYGISELLLVIYPEPSIPLNIIDYTDCDNQTDDNSDDENEINGNITLKNKIPEVLANYPTADHSNFTVTFHENLADAQSGDSKINENKYQNTTNNQIIYVRVVNNKTSCVHDDLTFNIVITPLPSFTVDTPVIVCLGEQTRLESINPNAIYSYEWTLKGDTTTLSTDAFYDVIKGGTYVVTATMQNGTLCERSQEILVNESIKPTLNEDDVVIVDDTNNNGLDTYSIKIITENQNLGIGDYQFAFIYINDNGFEIQTPFQDEPLFENITGGFYTVVVNDKNGCAPDAKLEVSVIQYPKFLTPNGDGKNDTWKIKGANSSFYPLSNITVVDRHGKIVAIIPIDNIGWDGTYNGKVLPSNDYWFKIQLIDRKGKIHQHQGHFSLIRR